MPSKNKKETKKPEKKAIVVPAVGNKLGEKRCCNKCNAKFYDLNKRPILCPKCGTEVDLEASAKSRRGRKKSDQNDNIPEEIEIDLVGMEEIEELEELEDDVSVVEELDEDIREEMEGDIGEIAEDSEKILEDLDDEADIIDSGDDDEPKDKD